MEKQKVKFFLPEGTINDATEYYCKLIERAFLKERYSVQIYNTNNDFNNDDIVISIRPGDLYALKGDYRKIISWFQGIGPEEYILLHGENLRSYIVSKFLNFLEYKALRRSDICIFVSESMKNHYEKKYSLDLNKKSIIIPCYNKALNENITQKFDDRYKHLNFVYAGGLFAWQCIDKTLIIFKEIQKIKPDATLTLLTNDSKNANHLIKKYKAQNVIVDYCKLSDLQTRLSQYKYAFLIRENHIVNKVSTPTKMNTYMAAGLIPIYTDVIDAFEKNINLGKFGIKVPHNSSINLIVDKILLHHHEVIDSQELLKTYSNVFRIFYNDEFYINELKQALN